MLSFPTIAFPPQAASVLTQRSVLQIKNCIFLFPAARCDTMPNVTALKANYPTHLICFGLIKTQTIHRNLFRLNPNSLDSLNQPCRKEILKSAEFWRSTLQALRGNQCMHRQQTEGNRESFAACNLQVTATSLLKAHKICPGMSGLRAARKATHICYLKEGI